MSLCAVRESGRSCLSALSEKVAEVVSLCCPRRGQKLSLCTVREGGKSCLSVLSEKGAKVVSLCCPRRGQKLSHSTVQEGSRKCLSVLPRICGYCLRAVFDYVEFVTLRKLSLSAVQKVAEIVIVLKFGPGRICL